MRAEMDTRADHTHALFRAALGPDDATSRTVEAKLRAEPQPGDPTRPDVARRDEP